jgi:hypothetical protein
MVKKMVASGDRDGRGRDLDQNDDAPRNGGAS